MKYNWSLVDVDGNVVDGNNPLEADMCEIVRALLSEGNDWF